MRKFLFLLFCWTIALGGFIYLTLLLKQPSTAFWGIVQSEKTVVRSPEAGEIHILKVHPGDSVRPGDTLLVLYRPEVERQQQESKFQLSKLDAERTDKLRSLQNEMQAVRVRWNQELQVVQQKQEFWELKLKREKELASVWLGEKDLEESPDSLIAFKQLEFQSQLEAINQQYHLKIKALQDQQNLSQPILDSDHDLAENDLAYWEAISEQQVIRAPHAGWVGEVMVNETEVTLKGTPLVEIWGNEARYVEGFIHENFTAELTAGQQVTLSSANNTDNKAQATIVKLGNRIVEFPDRLRKAPDVRLWGRETIIQLKPNNHFLIGEKVIIQVQ